MVTISSLQLQCIDFKKSPNHKVGILERRLWLLLKQHLQIEQLSFVKYVITSVRTFELLEILVLFYVTDRTFEF